MAEYIEREALPEKKERGFFLDDDFNAGWNACLNAIASIPAADVAPLRHGRWEPLTMSTDNGMEVLWVHEKCGCERYEKSNYCPNCGAKMDKDGDVDV